MTVILLPAAEPQPDPRDTDDEALGRHRDGQRFGLGYHAARRNPTRGVSASPTNEKSSPRTAPGPALPLRGGGRRPGAAMHHSWSWRRCTPARSCSPRKRTLPVLGVPVASKHLNGLDSLLSIVQMPGGHSGRDVRHRRSRSQERRPLCRGDPRPPGPRTRIQLDRFRASQTEKVMGLKLPEPKCILPGPPSDCSGAANWEGCSRSPLAGWDLK